MRRRLFWLWVRWWLSPRDWLILERRLFRSFYWRNRHEIMRRIAEQDHRALERTRYDDLIPVEREPGAWSDAITRYPLADEEAAE